VRGDRRRERDAAVRRRVGGHVVCGRLRAEEGAGGVDVEGFAPLGVGHVDGGHAADDAGEAEEMVEGAEGGDGGGDGFGYGGRVGDVDGNAEDAGFWELGGEGCDGWLGGAEGAFQVPDAEAQGAVFEHGSGAGEA